MGIKTKILFIAGILFCASPAFALWSHGGTGGGGSSSGDNLGNHTATMTLTVPYPYGIESGTGSFSGLNSDANKGTLFVSGAYSFSGLAAVFRTSDWKNLFSSAGISDGGAAISIMFQGPRTDGGSATGEFVTMYAKIDRWGLSDSVHGNGIEYDFHTADAVVNHSAGDNWYYCFDGTGQNIIGTSECLGYRTASPTDHQFQWWSKRITMYAPLEVTNGISPLDLSTGTLTYIDVNNKLSTVAVVGASFNGNNGTLTITAGGGGSSFWVSPATSALDMNGYAIRGSSVIITTGTLVVGTGANTITTAAGLLDATKLTNNLAVIDISAGTNVTAANISGGVLGATVRASSFPVSGVTAASYTNTNLTVNAQGIITAASNGSSGSTVYNATATANFLQGLTASTITTSGNINVSTNDVINVRNIIFGDSGQLWSLGSTTHSAVSTEYTLTDTSSDTISNLQFYAIAGATISFVADIGWSSSSSNAAGAKYALTGPAGSNVRWFLQGGSASATTSQGSQTASAFATLNGTAMGVASSQTFNEHMFGEIVVGQNGGPVNFQIALQTSAGNSTLRMGTQVTAWKE